VLLGYDEKDGLHWVTMIQRAWRVTPEALLALYQLSLGTAIAASASFTSLGSTKQACDRFG